MERKYAFIKNRYKYDEECIQFLEDMSYDGWKLHHIGLLFFSFVSCSKHLKYQIDYTDIDEEYNEVIESLGYTYITHWNFRNIYVSENKNAVDLQTDNEVYKQSLLQFYTRNSKLCFIILGIIFIKFYINLGLRFNNLMQYASLGIIIAFILTKVLKIKIGRAHV